MLKSFVRSVLTGFSLILVVGCSSTPETPDKSLIDTLNKDYCSSKGIETFITMDKGYKWIVLHQGKGLLLICKNGSKYYFD